MMDFEVCFFGTPDGFECVSLFKPLDYKIQRVLDLHTPRFGLAEFEILRVSHKIVDGDLYKIVGIYSNAFEIKLQRGGCFIGTAFLFKNCFLQDIDATLSSLETLHVNFKQAALKQNSKFSKSIQSAAAEIAVPDYSSFRLFEEPKKVTNFSEVKRDLVINVCSGSRLASFTDCFKLIVEDNLLDKVPSIYGLKDSLLAVESLTETQDFISLGALKRSSQRDLNTLFEQLSYLEDKNNRLEAENKILKTQLFELKDGVFANQIVNDKNFDLSGGGSADRMKASDFVGSLLNYKSGGGIDSQDLPKTQKRVVVNSAVSVEEKMPSQSPVVVEDQEDYSVWYIVFIVLVFGLILFFITLLVVDFDRVRSFVFPPPKVSVQEKIITKTPAPVQPNVSQHENDPKCALTESDKLTSVFLNEKYKDVDEVVAVAVEKCPPNQGCASELTSEFLNINKLTSKSLAVGMKYKLMSSKNCKFTTLDFPPAKSAGAK